MPDILFEPIKMASVTFAVCSRFVYQKVAKKAMAYGDTADNIIARPNNTPTNVYIIPRLINSDFINAKPFVRIERSSCCFVLSPFISILGTEFIMLQSLLLESY